MNPNWRSNVNWRPLTQADLDGLFTLYQRWETELEYPYRTSLEELEHELTRPETDLARDTLVAVDREGALVASAWVTFRSRQGSKHRTSITTTAIEKHAHLEVDALRWAEERAEERFVDLDDQLPRVLRAFSESTSEARIKRYESCGFEIVRYFVDMARPVDGPVPAADLPDGVEIVGYDERWARSTFDVRVEAFDDHWGTVPPTWDDFQHELAWPGTRLDLSSLAVAAGEVVSFCMVAVYPQDFALRGRSEGWIASLGTRRAWRRQGLASALIADAIHRMATEGLAYAVLGVDAANPTGAFGLYERLGFVEQTRSVALMKSIGQTTDR